SQFASHRGSLPAVASLTRCFGSRSGTVKWFDPQRGFGFIQSEGEDYFVHYSNIESTGFRSLADHEEVEFDVSEGDKGKKFCTNVTGPGGAPVKGSSRERQE
ncbi:CSP4, partial [Symbiodinium microadriaticum]